MAGEIFDHRLSAELLRRAQARYETELAIFDHALATYSDTAPEYRTASARLSEAQADVENARDAVRHQAARPPALANAWMRERLGQPAAPPDAPAVSEAKDDIGVAQGIFSAPAEPAPATVQPAPSAPPGPSVSRPGDKARARMGCATSLGVPLVVAAVLVAIAGLLGIAWDSGGSNPVAVSADSSCSESSLRRGDLQLIACTNPLSAPTSDTSTTDTSTTSTPASAVSSATAGTSAQTAPPTTAAGVTNLSGTYNFTQGPEPGCSGSSSTGQITVVADPSAGTATFDFGAGSTLAAALDGLAFSESDSSGGSWTGTFDTSGAVPTFQGKEALGSSPCNARVFDATRVSA
jgi:hypothetical protein